MDVNSPSRVKNQYHRNVTITDFEFESIDETEKKYINWRINKSKMKQIIYYMDLYYYIKHLYYYIILYNNINI